MPSLFLCLPVCLSVCLSLTPERYPREEWIHVYTDGSATADGGQNARVAVKKHCFNYSAETEAFMQAASNFQSSVCLREGSAETRCCDLDEIRGASNGVVFITQSRRSDWDGGYQSSRGRLWVHRKKDLQFILPLSLSLSLPSPPPPSPHLSPALCPLFLAHLWLQVRLSSSQTPSLFCRRIKQASEPPRPLEKMLLPVGLFYSAVVVVCWLLNVPSTC